MRYEHRILMLGLIAGLAGSAMSLFLLWQCDFSTQTRLTCAALILFLWLTTAFSLRNKVAFPLRTLSNLLGALREGDYSLRIRGARLDDALGEVIWEVNALTASLREQRLRAMEAMALLRKILAEIDVAMFGFDGNGRLQLINDSGKRLLGRTDEDLLGCRAEDLGLAGCLGGGAATGTRVCRTSSSSCQI
jgi:two-component system nitrogen regulation sensor histidine kinase NtrY